jgi:hypothetical protein
MESRTADAGKMHHGYDRLFPFPKSEPVIFCDSSPSAIPNARAKHARRLACTTCIIHQNSRGRHHFVYAFRFRIFPMGFARLSLPTPLAKYSSSGPAAETEPANYEQVPKDPD